MFVDHLVELEQEFYRVLAVDQFSVLELVDVFVGQETQNPLQLVKYFDLQHQGRLDVLRVQYGEELFLGQVDRLLQVFFSEKGREQNQVQLDQEARVLVENQGIQSF